MSPSEYLDWTARIRVNKYALNGSFSILVFLGEIPTDAGEWKSAPSYVGAHRVFVSRMDSGTGDPAKDTTEGFVHLSSAIKERLGGVSNRLEVDEVVPYLKRELGWRIQKSGGGQVDVGEVPSLEIVVIATPMKEGESFPEPCGDPKEHREVTRGYQGGCSE